MAMGALLAACVGSPAASSLVALDAWPDGFPLHFGVIYQAAYRDEPYEDADLPGALMVWERFTLVGPAGTTVGSGELSALDYREGGLTVTCGGEAYAEPESHDLVDPPGEMTATLDDQTIFNLVPERQVVVYEGVDGYPVCFQQEGTATVTFQGEPATGVMTGTYLLVNGSLELR